MRLGKVFLLRKRGLDLDYKTYEIIIAPEVLDKVSEIAEYISSNFSETSAKKRVKDLFEGFETLKTFPQVGFDADERVGFRIDPKHFIRGVVILGKYIALYYIDEERARVNIAYLFSTSEDYINALKREDSLGEE